MPYPILTLPYPFAKRLRQLLTPLELQQLQIAAGNSIDSLKPVIVVWQYGAKALNTTLFLPIFEISVLVPKSVSCNHNLYELYKCVLLFDFFENCLIKSVLRYLRFCNYIIKMGHNYLLPQQ
uniref:Uncharacterized protein n=1 Tax=Panagrellus redivivus TaxID=6233 RepID=A0A7E4W4R7_PANRE